MWWTAFFLSYYEILSYHQQRERQTHERHVGY